MEHLFLTYELSLLAKEKGFNKPCLAYYHNKQFQIVGGILNVALDLNGINLNAPLYHQIIDWFRTEYNIDILPNKKQLNGNYYYTVYQKDQMPFDTKQSENYYIALNIAIYRVFELI